MPTLPGKPITFRPRGVSDAVDATNVQPGAMTSLANLMPAPHTRDMFIPRPASTLGYAFGAFTTPAGITALLVVGTRAYGMISSADVASRDVPFCYDFATGANVPISGGTAANLPVTQSTSGDWNPPTMAVVASRILVTHPGFAGGSGSYFGWIDISGLSSTSLTGDTHSNMTIDNLSSNPIQAGWQIGMSIAGAGIPAGTLIAALTTTGVTLSQAATATTAGVALTVTGGTSAAPVWGSGNTNGNALASVPLAVAQFYGRAYFAVGNGVVYSDSGIPCQVTNATQALAFNNGLAVTALAGLPLSSPVQGGILQALIAFQGDSNMVQIAGDQALGNLSTNNLNVATGTLAPLSICPTTKGLSFISPEGLRIISFSGFCSEPIGSNGEGVTVPFINALFPSRMCAAFNQDVLRVTVQNGAVSGGPLQEYWFHMKLPAWTGPHTFPATHIQPYAGNEQGFILSASGVNGKIWQGPVEPKVTSTYTENGTALSWTYRPVLLADNLAMQANAMVQAALMCSLPVQANIQIQAIDDQGNTLDTVSIAGPATVPAVWGSFTWGAAVWASISGLVFQKAINWNLPIVFKQMTMQITGPSQTTVVMGNLYMRVEELNYLGAA